MGFAIAAVVSRLARSYFLDFSCGVVSDTSPTGLSVALTVSFVASLLLGLFTFPRWYSLLALGAVVFVFLAVP